VKSEQKGFVAKLCQFQPQFTCYIVMHCNRTHTHSNKNSKKSILTKCG